MTEHSIIMRDHEVRAILAGTKTQARRPAKFPGSPPTTEDATRRYGALGFTLEAGFFDARCPFGAPGDALWVREYHAVQPCNCCVRYRADQKIEHANERWRPSIHMPRWASRLTLDVVSVRVERVQAISDADIAAEGVDAALAERLVRDTPGALRALREVTHSRLSDPRECWRIAWTLTYGAESWDANPWVWAIEFRRRP